MKKLLATLILTLLIWNVKAQNIYVLGDYIVHDWSQGERETVAAVYKNGELLYTTPANNTIVFPKTIFWGFRQCIAIFPDIPFHFSTLYHRKTVEIFFCPLYCFPYYISLLQLT